MTKYITQERARYWPITSELMAQYKDGSHTGKYGGNLHWKDQHAQYHRDGDKPAIISRDGTLEWYQRHLLHRDGDKPAIIQANGALVWYQNNLVHRSHGPAIIYSDGKREWCINNKNITLEVNEWLAGEEWHGTPEQIAEFQLRFS